MVNKDYYAILGISRLATEDEIKRAYKQKALKHHPDKNRDDVDAEKKFTDISEAYEMLSDPTKRSVYDRFGSDDLRNYFNGESRSNSRHSFSTGNYHSSFGTNSTYDSYNNYFIRYKDPTTFYDLYVTLDEVYQGATRKLKVTRKRYKPELQIAVKDEKLLEIQIKPGWKEGTKITFENEGDEGDQYTIAGDIVFIIRDKPHPLFERSNSDIIYRVKLTLKQALLGTLIVIPFLDSTKSPYQLRTYQEILTPQTEKRFPNEGLPYPKDPTKRGDLIVKFDILFPKLLLNEQRALADCCFSNSIDFYQPYDSVLHMTIIDQTQQQQQQQQQTLPSQPQLISAPTLTSSLQSQPSFRSNSSSNNNNHNHHHHHHQKSHHRHINNNGRQKSPSNQTKSAPVRIPPPIPPRPSPTSLHLHEPNDAQTPQFDRSSSINVESSPFHHATSLCQVFKNAILDRYDLNEYSTWILSADRKQYEVTFVSEAGTFCEELLHRLSEIGIGRLPGTRVAVVPLTYAIGYSKLLPLSSYKVPTLSTTSLKRAADYVPKITRVTSSSTIPPPRPIQRRKSIRADFMQSIRSRLMVFQVVQAIRAQSSITFDFVVLVTLASILATLGLLENSSIILVASMLISPLMGPILAIVFGLCIHDRSLWKAGLRSEFFGLFICVSCGFLIGLGTSVWETNWGSTTSFPTPEMKARGDLTRLSVGSMIALPSGAGVALSVLGGNAGSLVGVAISASLLPPAVNSGLLLGYSLLTAAIPNSFGRRSNETYIFKRKIYPFNQMTCQTFLSNEYRSLYSCNMSIETFILAIASFLLTLVNIICIVLCALIVLRIKEVAPSGTTDDEQESDTDRFFHDDMRRFRDYQKTIHNAQEIDEENKLGHSMVFLPSDSAKRERRKQLLALASLHDLDMTNENDLTLNNSEARDKVKQLYKTMVQFDQDAKRLDISLKHKQTLPTLMMDVLPPKWTELFQHQQEKDRAQQPDHQKGARTHGSYQWRNPAHYNTYQACSIQPANSFHQHLPPSPRKFRTQSYSSNPFVVRSVSFTEQESETQLRGTRFRLTKATIRIDDEDEEQEQEQQHQQLTTEQDYHV
ncbi:unnamed protein product [Adineta steineri]|uniref:J domain-containing protein n=1 Tax=Adineta steineri TaxID=433720 RepID=A0A819J7U9_9BILA|nr:unnamed protein product [Adineta steineri]